MNKKYYINSFNLFYGLNEVVGNKFALSAYNDSYTLESESFDIKTILSMVLKGYEENESEINSLGIDIMHLISVVVKEDYL